MKPRRLVALGVALASITMAGGADAAYKKAAPERVTPPPEAVEYELPTTGKNIPRKDGGWLNVEFPGPSMTVKFFDAEKKPVAPNVVRASARFRYAYKSDMNRTVLNRDGDALVSPGNVQPPHNFLVTLTLVPGGEADYNSFGEYEIYTFKFP